MRHSTSKQRKSPLRVDVIDVEGEQVEVRRKDITRIYLRIDARGQAVITAPTRAADATIVAFVAAKRGWLEARRQRLVGADSLPRPADDDVEELRARVDALVPEWESRLGVSVAHVTLRHMRTRWGSCTPATGRIRLNTALAGVDDDLLEYVLVHELTHLDVANHGPRFQALMTARLPDWHAHRRRLGRYTLT